MRILMHNAMQTSNPGRYIRHLTIHLVKKFRRNPLAHWACEAHDTKKS